MDIDVGPQSTIRYVMPLVASQAGFDALMEMEFHGMSASSSINYANFMRTKVVKVSLIGARSASWILRAKPRSFCLSRSGHRCQPLWNGTLGGIGRLISICRTPEYLFSAIT